MSMGIETLESELAHVSVETKAEGNNLLQKENGVSNPESGITFGSHGTDEPGKKEVDILPENSIPKDAVDEWPATKQFHTFYIVKYRLYDDQKTRVIFDQADQELRRLNQARFQLTEKIRANRAHRAQVKAQLKDVEGERDQFKQIMDEKKKEMEPLNHALGKLRNSNTGGRDRDRSFIYSSEEELNDAIKSLQYYMQHESIPLSEEKKIIREIKQLEGTREQVIANAATRAKIQDSLGQKEVIQDQVKLIGVGLDGVRKENQLVWDKIVQLRGERNAIEDATKELEAELKIVSESRDNAYEKIKELRKQLDQGNAPYYEYRRLLTKARELAAKKDVEGLRDLVDTEVDKFISLWGSTKEFRDDYERRILPSLDMRQMSRDGRMRNPDEKPLVVHEPPPPPTPAKTETVAKLQPKQLKEESVASTNQKEQGSKQQKESTKKVTAPEITVEEVRAVKDKELEKPEQDPLPVVVKNEVNEAKLKELKREEEIAKAKQALERKKKLAEKAAAKAAIKAQKEAEKKQKEREKKAKKKAAASVSVVPEEQSEADVVAEPEKAVQASAPPKAKERKEKTVRPRGRAKGPDSLPKIILKRKKATTNYWIWAAAVAAILVVLLSVIGYYYLM